MTAAQIWAKQGGLIEENFFGGWLLVDIHALYERETPAKNTRFRFQVMMNNNEQSCVTQFRGIELARKWLYAEMSMDELERHVANKQARMFF